MADIVITITDAGRQEIINASNTGTEKVLISEIGIGRGAYEPSASQVALQDEIKRLTTFGGTVVASDTIHVSIRDETSDAYNIHEVGLFTESGTLFAVYSQTDPIVEKTAKSIMLLAVDVVLQTLNAENITFGNVEFVNPPASETMPGIARIATNSEADEGKDDLTILTPKKASDRFMMVSRLFSELSDLSDVDFETVLKNLRLGDAAKRGVGVGKNQIPDMGSFACLMGDVGYQYLPGGILLQWGRIDVPTTGIDITTNFPIAFPNKCLRVFSTQDYTPGSGAVGYIACNGFNVGRFSFIARAGKPGLGASFFAVGC